VTAGQPAQFVGITLGIPPRGAADAARPRHGLRMLSVSGMVIAGR